MEHLPYGTKVDAGRPPYYTPILAFRFTEPAPFVVRPDGERYASIVRTTPFARPPLAALRKTLEWILEKDHPARGETDPAAIAGVSGRGRRRAASPPPPARVTDRS